jgi:2-polyprenyl-3-methyl-5-hydroxy-6-metoxy-1,4-benzoquinol methylase
MSFFKKKKNYKVDSKEVGLEIEFLALSFLLKLEHLHYGYFKDGLAGTISNLKKAQENYEELLISNIPAGTKSILDVGCGAGQTALNLTLKGYKVDCVSPNEHLTKYAKNLTGDKVRYYQCKLQDLKCAEKYDLVLFSESFQYIPVDQGIPTALKFLNPGGYIMVSDFFKNDPERKSKLGGGHEYEKWTQLRSTFPVKTIIEKDITHEISPTVDLFNQFTLQVVKPSWESLWALGEERFPLVIKLAKRLYRKKLKKMEQKHFTGQRNAENFRKYKKYMFYLFQAEN